MILTKESTKKRMIQMGSETLADFELLELILRRGKRNVSPQEIARLITSDNDTYRYLPRCHRVEEITERYNVTEEQASALLAAMELGKRIIQSESLKAEHIVTPSDAAQFIMSRLRHETHEKFLVILLNTKNRVIRVIQIAEGSLTSAVVHPREIYAPAVVNHAASILVAHNHPSGDPYPSEEDRKLTVALEKAGNILGIPLLDHVIIGDGRHYSFKEHGGL